MLKIKQLGLLLLFLVFAPFAAAAEEQMTPNLWKLQDKDTTIYIFGTVHLMKKGVNWYTPGVDRALNEADRLYLELSPRDTNPLVIQSLILRHGIITDGRTLEGMVGAEDYGKMIDVLEDMDVPLIGFNAMRPWLAATAMTIQVSAANGYLPEYGVETVLTKKANEKGVKIKGLETAEFQIGIFGDMPEEAQKAFFVATIDEVDHVDAMFEVMKNAWLEGDTETLSKLLNSDFEIYPQAAEKLLYSRNRNWADKVEKLMKKDGTFMIAVGTGHLVGHKNLIEILTNRGYQITLLR